MTYRDDHDAAIARAEALEREAADLREKNEALARENEELAAERARLAEQLDGPRRALARLAGEKEVVLAPAAEIEQPVAPGRLVSSALHRHTGLAMLVAASPMALVIALAAVTGSAMVAIIGLVLAIAGGGLTLAVLVGFDMKRERRLLAEVPLPLDVPGYLAYLDTPHPRNTVMRVIVELVSAPTQAPDLVLRAVTNSMPGSEASLDGATLVIKSPALQARISDGTIPDNVRLHRWFRRLLTRALLPVAAVHPVRSIRVE